MPRADKAKMCGKATNGERYREVRELELDNSEAMVEPRGDPGGGEFCKLM